VEPEQIAEEAARIATRIAAFPRHATVGAKSAIFAAANPDVDGFARETEVVRSCFENAATRALVSAFLIR
ncbi:hypothetical protein ACVBEH_19935, partial [Roseateles sp. GG27B]